MSLYNPIPNPVHMIKLDEQRILDKHVKNRPYATRILEIYSVKSADLDIIKCPFLQDSELQEAVPRFIFSELYSSCYLKRLDYLEKGIIIQFRLGP